MSLASYAFDAVSMLYGDVASIIIITEDKKREILIVSTVMITTSSRSQLEGIHS